MDVWVISDHEDLTNRIRLLLERPENGCAYVRVSNVAGCTHSGVLSAAADDVVFYAVPQLLPHDFDGLRQLRATCRARLTVVAPMTDNAIVLRAIRAGAEDFLDADGDLNAEIAAFLTKARFDKSQPGGKGKLVTVLSCHAPSDASILSVNLATVIARSIGSSALLDFHRHGGDLALLLKLTPRHTLQDLVMQQQGIDQVMFEQALARHDSGARLLASPQWPEKEDGTYPESYQEIVKLALGTHPFVIVSSEDAQHLSQLMPLSSSDHIVFAMRLDLLSLHRAQNLLELLRRNQVSPDLIEVVAMETGRPGELPVAAIAKSLGVPRIHLIPDDAMANTVSINLGHPLVLEAPTSPASIAIKRLAARLAGIEKKEPPVRRNGHFAIARAVALEAVSALVGRLQ